MTLDASARLTGPPREPSGDIRELARSGRFLQYRASPVRAYPSGDWLEYDFSFSRRQEARLSILAAWAGMRRLRREVELYVPWGSVTHWRFEVEEGR